MMDTAKLDSVMDACLSLKDRMDRRDAARADAEDKKVRLEDHGGAWFIIVNGKTDEHFTPADGGKAAAEEYLARLLKQPGYKRA